MANKWLTEGRRLWVALTAVVLAVCVTGTVLTRGVMEHLPSREQNAAGGSLVDQTPWRTAEALAPLAVSAEEVRYARDAERLADHEVDQAFAMALREASAERPPLKGEALTLSQKVAGLKQTLEQDQAQVNNLKQQASGAGGAAAVADQMEVAQAQLGLDQDELTDAENDLARASGDKGVEIQQELTAREAEMEKYDSGVTQAAPIAAISMQRYGTLYGRLQAWVSQRSRMKLLQQAETEARSRAVSLAREHDQLQQQASKTSRNNAAAQQMAGVNGAPLTKHQRLEQIAEMTAQRSVLGILDDRQQTEEQLANVYERWVQQVKTQHGIVRHLLLQSLAWVSLILLMAAVSGAALRRVLGRMRLERRSATTLTTIAELGIQTLAVLLILLVVFGFPRQAPTVLGLLTAGLTVVFQDFILAFFGWFVLMGKNGIRVGDQVEIDGVGGEVAEIGLFRTALLETGNWTDKGHPTGRQITFVNKFAVAGQYFNFSTAGQWLWDQITVNVPRSEDTYKTIEAIHAAVVAETQKVSDLAEEEWKRTAGDKPVGQFRATPSVDVRPAASGVDLVVRYVTRAVDRFETRNRLYQLLLRLIDGATVKPEKPA